jgi:hypothetical protein
MGPGQDLPPKCEWYGRGLRRWTCRDHASRSVRSWDELFRCIDGTGERVSETSSALRQWRGYRVMYRRSKYTCIELDIHGRRRSTLEAELHCIEGVVEI